MKPPAAPSYTEVFGRTLVEMAARDKRVVAVTAAMPEGTGLAKFAEAYPGRFFDVGIAEQHAVTFAAGMATEGFRPFVAIYSTFLQRAYDQILHDVCLERLPVTLALDRGGLVGEDGATHHGVFDLSYLRSLPNLTVMAPRNENELRRMMAACLQHDGPVAFRYPRGSATGCALDADPVPVPIGRAEVLTEGDDVVILAIGNAVSEALIAHEHLEAQGVAATVVDARFVKPLDTTLLIDLVRRIPRLVTVEENALQGGFGSAVLEALSDDGIRHVAVRRIGIPNTFVEHGPLPLLRAKYGLDAPAIARSVLQLLQQSQVPILSTRTQRG
jgi:1-deoxy-D-xylulose-5-phosphate synthase